MSSIKDNTISDFAKAQLLKYGWSEGKGLGKNENGLIEPIKTKVKLNNEGIGFKKPQENWWESLMTKSLKNIEVNQSSETVSFNVINKDATTNILSNKASSKESKPFFKSSILKNGILIKDSSITSFESPPQNEISQKFTFSDELFKACRGRTAHKGARHGISMSGKLSRIEAQEKAMALFIQNNGISADVFTQSTINFQKRDNKKGTCQEDAEIPTVEPLDSDLPPIEIQTESNCVDSKTRRRRYRKNMSNLMQELEKMGFEDTEKKTEPTNHRKHFNHLAKELKTKCKIYEFDRISESEKNSSWYKAIKKSEKPHKSKKYSKALKEALQQLSEEMSISQLTQVSNYTESSVYKTKHKSKEEKRKSSSKKKKKLKRQCEEDIKCLATALELDSQKNNEEPQVFMENNNQNREFLDLRLRSVSKYHSRNCTVYINSFTDPIRQLSKTNCKKVKKKKKKNKKKILKQFEASCPQSDDTKFMKLSDQLLNISLGSNTAD